MGLLATQATVTTSPVKLCTIPPGPCSVVLSNSSASNAVYVGTGSGTVSMSSGTPVPAGKSVTLTLAAGNAGAVLRAVSAATAVVGVLISQPGAFALPEVLVPGAGIPAGSSTPGLAVPGKMIPGSPG